MSQSSLNPTQTKAMLTQVADAIIAAEPELSEADRRLGDGDHGLGMQRGMTAAKEALAEVAEDAGVGDLFSAVGTAMMSSMGGASGVVFGSLFRAGKKALKESPDAFTSAGLAATLRGAAEAVMKRGGAKPGDKTMLDALVPAADVAEASPEAPVSDTLEAAAAAAEKGRDDSEALIATMGRAKTLGEKSVGHPDAGACSVAIILRTMANFAKG
jgi:dihydroxyacetone kinase phosphoprotein-dependent L subunit